MSSDEAAFDAEDPEHVSFILMRATETFDEQERVWSRAAWTSSAEPQVACGRPGTEAHLVAVFDSAGTLLSAFSEEGTRGRPRAMMPLVMTDFGSVLVWGINRSDHHRLGAIAHLIR